MEIEDLHKLVYYQRADAIQRLHHDEGLVLFLNFQTFGDLRNKLRRGLHGYHVDDTRNVFHFMNVRVSWSPLIEHTEGYVYGREKLT